MAEKKKRKRWQKILGILLAIVIIPGILYGSVKAAEWFDQQLTFTPDTQPETEDVAVSDTGADAHTERFLAALEKCGEEDYSGNVISGDFVCGVPECTLAGVPPKKPEQKVGKEVEEPLAESGCPPARDLGPWAPNNGLGEDFEVTCNETNCTGTHIQLWWPAGSGQEWGTQEISVFLPPGLSIEVQDGAGRGWEYALSCSLEEIESQMVADNTRRSDDTSYFGRVDIEDLIDTGLVVVRFDRR